MTTKMVSMIYVSSAPGRMNTAELDEILRISRRNNERDAISGLLLYADGNFIQAVEGPQAAIEALLGRLDRDPRHYDITIVGRIPLDQRQFADWSMGFRRFDGSEGEAISAAFFDLKTPLADLNEERSSSVAHRLLERFRQTNIA